MEYSKLEGNTKPKIPDFHLEKMTDLSAVEELEVRLLDDETKKLVVRY